MAVVNVKLISSGLEGVRIMDAGAFLQKIITNPMLMVLAIRRGLPTWMQRRRVSSHSKGRDCAVIDRCGIMVNLYRIIDMESTA